MGAAPNIPGTRWLLLLAAIFLVAPGACVRADDAPRAQQIQFDELPARSVGDPPIVLHARATSGLPPAFELLSGPAVLEKGVLRLTGAPGLVIVRATQEGNARFKAATPVERAFAVNREPRPPVFVVQPQDARLLPGEPLTLVAEASGEPRPAYQWRRNGNVISGAEGPTLSLPAVTPSDTGSYDVVATNPSGSVASEPARVTLGKRTQRIFFNAPTSVRAGEVVLLSAAATSGLPVTFRLEAGGGFLSGSTLTADSGTVVIRAVQDGNEAYEAAESVVQTIAVTPTLSGQRAR